jgi:hypothetical protein
MNPRRSFNGLSGSLSHELIPPISSAKFPRNKVLSVTGKNTFCTTGPACEPGQSFFRRPQ